MKNVFQMSIPDMTKEDNGKRKMSGSYEDNEQEKNFQEVESWPNQNSTSKGVERPSIQRNFRIALAQ